MANIEYLRVMIRRMTRETKLYKLLKEELTAQGYWKAKPRGNPKKAKARSDEVKTSNAS